MHILLVSKACLVGAYQTKLEAIAAHHDVRLTVIVPPAWRDPAGTVHLERAHTEGYELLVDPIRFNGRYHLHYYPRLPKRLRDLRPDLLHMDEEPYNLATWLAVQQAGRLGIRSLFFSWQNLNNWYPPPFSWMERQVLRSVDFAIMGNRAAVDVWEARGYRGPRRVIPQFGVSLEHFYPVPRPAERPLTIGAAGRFVPEKGLDVLLRAAGTLRGNWEMRLAGDGPERAMLKGTAEEVGIGERVSWPGVLPSTAMPDFLRGLDVLVLPSRTRRNWKEQFGRVLIEAMACGVVVVGSDSGEIPHVIGQAGLVFPEDDVEILGRKLQVLLDRPVERKKLAAAGRARVEAHYSQAQIAAQTVEVYRTLLAEK